MSFSAFKGMRFYSLPDDLPIGSQIDADPRNALMTAEMLGAALAAFKFVPCASQDRIKHGFVPPLHKSAKPLVHVSGDCWFFALKTQEKILPAPAVEDELAPKVDAMEQDKGRSLSRKEKQVLKEEIIQTMLPRCYTKSSVLHGYIDTKRKVLVLGAASSAKCELVMALLRKALGTLPALPFFDGHVLAECLQVWAKNQGLPEGFTQGAKVKFKAPDEEGAKSSFDNCHLMADDIQSQFEDKLVVMLELCIDEVMDFCIKDDGSLSGVKYKDKLVGANDEMGWDDVLGRLDADMLLLHDSHIKLMDAFARSAKALDAGGQNAAGAE